MEQKLNHDPILVPYREAEKLGPEMVGAKAFSVAKMDQNGILVPEGLVLPKSAWKNFQRPERSRALLAGIERRLPKERYIVRSSAIGEDSGTFSWAGCFDTIAEVDPDHMAEAILQCAASLKGKRAAAYASLHSDLPVIREMAILIQEYLPAQFSGVGFSVNPVTGRQEMVIEYQQGKSGSVVSGEGFSSVALFSARDLSPQGEYPAWLTSVAHMIRRVERLFGAAVDVEWLWKHERLYILQARPITTLQEE